MGGAPGGSGAPASGTISAISAPVNARVRLPPTWSPGGCSPPGGGGVTISPPTVGDGVGDGDSVGDGDGDGDSVGDGDGDGDSVGDGDGDGDGWASSKQKLMWLMPLPPGAVKPVSAVAPS